MTSNDDASSESEILGRAAKIRASYEGRLRSFLQEHVPEQLPQLDDEHQRLVRLLGRNPETVVCLVGPSGIGKSTLLNAIVADAGTLVPSGGVGPLTALATEVRYSDKQRFRVMYHPKKNLWNVAFALNAHVRRQQLAATGQAQGIQQEAPVETVTAEAETEPRRLEEYIRMARLMVTGNQDNDRPVEYLADAITMACSNKPSWGSVLSEEDVGRLERIRAALQRAETGQPLESESVEDGRAFRQLLREHAAGFLSPLIRHIEVGWPAQLLRDGLVLVDLPGVGVAGDLYKLETQKYIRERARAVLLVVNRAGLTDSVMDLLRSTGYWDRLLVSSDEPDADPCSLLLTVTHVDDIAEEEWRNQEVDAEDRPPFSKAQQFAATQDRLRDGLRNQFSQLMEAFAPSDSGELVLRARKAAVASILEQLEVHPVSALQYRKVLMDNDDDRPFLKTVESSGVPTLCQALAAFNDGQRVQRIQAIDTVTRRFVSALATQVSLIDSSWRSNRAAEQAERLRAAMSPVLDAKSREYESRRASFRNYLKETVPEKIRVAVLEAKDQARKDVAKYLRSLRDAHWATLRAAVTRGGTYYGSRHINLPDDIALRFQDPVAAVWSQDLLKAIRKETYSLASDIREMVEELCDAASAEHAAFIDERVVLGQKKLVSSQAERLRDVGKEAVDELRDTVKTKIVEQIRKPIRDACEKFVEAGHHVGAGVRERILSMFEELAEEATASASRPTQTTLLEKYNTVATEIRTAFRDWGNPLQSTIDAVAERHGDHARRSDAQKRQRVLQQISELQVAELGLTESVNGLS